MDATNTTTSTNDTTTPSSRKRSRSATPVRRSSTAPTGQRPESEADLERAARLRDPSTRVVALNTLLQLSHSHDINYGLTGDSVLQALVHIAVECIQWTEEEAEEENLAGTPTDSANDKDHPQPNDTKEKDDRPVFSSDGTWLRPPTNRAARWAGHWQVYLDPLGKRSEVPLQALHTLHVVAMILRNLSYVAANHRLMAYQPQVLDILTGCLYDGYHANYDNGLQDEGVGTGSLAATALQAFLHLLSMLDLSGQRLLVDRLFYDPVAATEGPVVPQSSPVLATAHHHHHQQQQNDGYDTFGQAMDGSWGFGGLGIARKLDTREDVMEDVTKDFVLSFASDYLVSVWSLFAGLAYVLTHEGAPPRSVVLMALDLLQELVNQARVGVVGHVDLDDSPDEFPTLRAVLVQLPNAVLCRLIDLLSVPRVGPDALEYTNDPVRKIVTRPVAYYKWKAGYDGNLDTDVRDRVLDILVPLLELDAPRLAGRLGGAADTETSIIPSPRLWDALLPILTTTAGKSDSPHLATQIMVELAKDPSNAPGFHYLQARMLTLACQNDRVAHTWGQVSQLLSLRPREDDEDAASDEASSSSGAASDEAENVTN